MTSSQRPPRAASAKKRGRRRHLVVQATTGARTLRPLSPALLARVTGGGDQTNLPIFCEMQVVGHTYTAEDRSAAYFHGGYWYVEPDWK